MQAVTPRCRDVLLSVACHEINPSAAQVILLHEALAVLVRYYRLPPGLAAIQVGVKP